MSTLSFYDRQHIQAILKQEGSVANIFNAFIRNVSPFLAQWQERNTNSVWLRNQSIEGNIDKYLEQLQSTLLSNLVSFQIDAWKRSDTKNEDFIKSYIKGMAISPQVKEGMFSRNAEALASLKKGFDARGNNLSGAVWNIAQASKEQLEFYLKSGIGQGRSAASIGQDVRQLLNEPDKRFHRVKDKETGKLVMSQPMKDYHPGQGVYRSAKMNALRLTATTTNIAYRSADYDRWSQQDFCLGIRIQRSANNKGPCKICDPMVGEYPKTFKFTGFHPFCICFATPIVMEPDDLADFLLDETVPEEQVIKTIPEAAQSFVKDNKAVVGGSYWYKDNFTKEGKLNAMPTVTNPKTETITVKDTPKVVNTNFKTVEEAQDYARNVLGVKRADYSDLSVEMANTLNDAAQTLPEEYRPQFMGSSKNMQKGLRRNLGNKSHYGVSIDGVLFIEEDGQYKVESGMNVGINRKTLKSIEKSKQEREEEYFNRTGKHYTFNQEGKATPYHEMGHVYDHYDNQSGSPEWQSLSERWAKEANTYYIEKPSEAFAEAWAATFLNKELPPYIEEYMKKFKKKK